MVTFSTNDSASKLDKKFKVNKSDKHTAIISCDEFIDAKQDTDECGTCDATLEYSKVENAGWCSSCVMWYELSTAKKSIPFDIPTAEDIKPDIVSIENSYSDDVSIKPQPEPKGSFAELKRRGLRITTYDEGVG